MYRGFRPLGASMPTKETVRQWLNSTRTAPDDGAVVSRLAITVGNSAVIGRISSGAVETTHVLMDIVMLELDTTGVAVVLNEAVPNKPSSLRQYVGHAYTFTDESAAAQAHGTIITQMEQGFGRLKQAVDGVYRPAVLQRAFDLDASGLGGAGIGL